MHNLDQTLHNVKLMMVELLDMRVTCKPFFLSDSSVSDNNTVEGKYAGIIDQESIKNTTYNM